MNDGFEMTLPMMAESMGPKDDLDQQTPKGRLKTSRL
jgi:hypothetical protein